MARKKERTGCRVMILIEGVKFHCHLEAGHEGLHEEAGNVDGKYRCYLIRWRGDSRELCENCGVRAEQRVECEHCGSKICLNCRDPKASEELNLICKKCPKEEDDE